ncbi:MAG: methyltransferase domain-containing protein, partial [Anaerolineales bacterium]|nr:methyltransferase domain-containing protein [Anaerolineales bacterium]
MTHPHIGLRQQLVAELRRQGHIRSGLVADAFMTVPRHLFAPQVSPEEAYANQVVPLKQNGQQMISTLSQPAMMAIMLEALELQPGMSVLEIGTGSGYNAALLRQIVGPTGRIVSVDVEADLVAQAEQNLAGAGYGDVQVAVGDGGLGFSRQAPYDRIIAT